jgi:hypothetical protein
MKEKENEGKEEERNESEGMEGGGELSKLTHSLDHRRRLPSDGFTSRGGSPPHDVMHSIPLLLSDVPVVQA